MHTRISPAVRLAPLLAAGLALAAQAAPITWDGGPAGTGTAWRDGTNWVGDVMPGSADEAIFSTTGTNALLIGIDLAAAGGTQQVGAISLTGGTNRTIENASASTDGLLLVNGVGGASFSNSTARTLVIQRDGSGGRALQLAISTNAARIAVTSGNGNVTLAAPIQDADGPLTLVKSGNGTLVLRNPTNSFTGDVVVEAGALVFNSVSYEGLPSSLGAGAHVWAALTVAGSDTTLQLGSAGENSFVAGTQTLDRPITLTNATVAGTALKFTLNTNNTTWVIAGPISNQLSGVATNLYRFHTATTTSNMIRVDSQLTDGSGGRPMALDRQAASSVSPVVYLTNPSNTFSAGVTLNAGTLDVASLANIGQASSLGTGLTDPRITFGAGGASATTLRILGTNSMITDRPLVLGGTNSALTLINGMNTPSAGVSFTFPGTITNLAPGTVATAPRLFTLGGSNAACTNVLAGVLTDGVGGVRLSIIVSAPSAWRLSGDSSSYTGSNVIQNGSTLEFTSIANSGQPSALGAGTNFGFVSAGASFNTVFRYAGTQSAGHSSDRTINLINNTYAFVFDASGTGPLTLNGPISYLSSAGGSPLLVLTGTSTATNEFGSAYYDSATNSFARIQKTGSGTWRLTGLNSHSNSVTLTGGTLELVATNFAIGTPNPLGRGSTGPNNLILGGATLRYLGAGASLPRQFRLDASSTIESSGSGALDMTTAGSVQFNNTGDRTLTLAGSNTNNNFLRAPLTNTSGFVVSLAKTGSGRWILTSTNHSYNGTTTVSGGTLLVNGALLGSGAIAVSNATLGGSGSLTGNAALNGATLAPGSDAVGQIAFGNTLAVTTNSTLNWELSASTNDTVNAGSLQFSGPWTVRLSRVGVVTPNPSSNYLLFSAGSVSGFAPGSVTIDYGTTGWTNATVQQVGSTIVLTGLSDPSALTPFAVWQTNYFGATNNPSAAHDADPDGDELANLLEYAFGTVPTSAGSQVLPAVSNNGSYLTITVPRNSNATDISYIVEESADLTSWSTVTTLTATNPAPAGSAVTVSGTNAIAPGGRDNLRVRVTLP